MTRIEEIRETCEKARRLFEWTPQQEMKHDIPYLLARLEQAEKALENVRDHPDCDWTDTIGETFGYRGGVRDGHRCAAKVVDAYFAAQEQSS